MATFTADIQPYDLAVFSTFEAGLGWELDKDRCALLVHDMLPYYLSVLPAAQHEAVTTNAGRLVAAARSCEVPVLASAPRPASEPAQRGLGGRLWGIGPTPAEAATSAVPELQDGPVAWVAKRSLSAFLLRHRPRGRAAPTRPRPARHRRGFRLRRRRRHHVRRPGPRHRGLRRRRCRRRRRPHAARGGPHSGRPQHRPGHPCRPRPRNARLTATAHGSAGAGLSQGEESVRLLLALRMTPAADGTDRDVDRQSRRLPHGEAACLLSLSPPRPAC